MFEFCKNNIEGIEFIYIDSKEVTETRKFLEKRLVNAFTVPGTRNFHQFFPIDKLNIAAKMCSEDEEIALTHNFDSEVAEKEMDVLPSEYICCLYDQHWWIGAVQDINLEEKDVAVKFMHPHGPSASFQWPSRDDIYWVPNKHIICKIDIPLTDTGRTYHISMDNVKKI